ncbi:NUDIX hydrolase [Alloscardovia venturai]|uniref:NUDIX hydrolase n=1 Tax=Alloscardovia venturai TaxID=1769421 RepID=A0ABW2Y8G8_9BIFI
MGKTKKDKQSPHIVRAAGTVTYRYSDGGEIEVCVIHRPRYNDWSWPKGKLNANESLFHAAVRETAEETGYDVMLQSPIGFVSYPLGTHGEDTSFMPLPLASRCAPDTDITSAIASDIKIKQVTYWTAQCIGEPDTSLYTWRESTFLHATRATNDETDEVRWVSIDEAIKLLTRDDDKNIARNFARRIAQHSITNASTIILVRNAQCISAKKWEGHPIDRPLTPQGAAQAFALLPELSSYLPSRLYATNALRVVSTLAPWKQATGENIRILTVEDDTASRYHERTYTVTSPRHIRPQSNDCLYALGEVLEYALGGPHRTSVFAATRRQLAQMSQTLSQFAENECVASQLRRALNSKKSLKHAEALALTIVPSPDASQGCTILNAMKVKPIVF